MIKIILGENEGGRISDSFFKTMGYHEIYDVFLGRVKDKEISLYFPEVYIHPNIFAIMIRKIIQDHADGDHNITILTHSDVLVSTLGQAIIYEIIEPEDVEIEIRDVSGNTYPTFDKNGDLENWRIGFLNPNIWRI